MTNQWLGYYDLEVRTTNHPDRFTSQGVMWSSREEAEREGNRLETGAPYGAAYRWTPLLEWRVVAYGSEQAAEDTRMDAEYASRVAWWRSYQSTFGRGGVDHPLAIDENERYMASPDAVAEEYALRAGNYPG